MLTIYHNPTCCKSRQALEILRKNGLDPSVIAYLEQTPPAARIGDLAELPGRMPEHALPLIETGNE